MKYPPYSHTITSCNDGCFIKLELIDCPRYLRSHKKWIPTTFYSLIGVSRSSSNSRDFPEGRPQNITALKVQENILIEL